MADALLHALAGALGSFFALLILHPLNQVRLLRQIGKSGVTDGEGIGGTVKLLKEMSRGGLTSLYFGVVPSLTVSTISQAIYFAFYHAANGLVVWRSLLASVLTCFITSPIWVATTRLQLAQDQTGKARRGGGVFALVFQACHIVNSEGVLALWAGISSSLWLCAVPVMQFWMYEFTRFFSQSPEHPTALEALAMGGSSRLIASAITYPLQLAQTRQRADAQIGSILKVLSSVVRERGVSALYAGFEAKIFLTLLNGAFMMCFYEKILQFVTWILDTTHPH